MCGIAGAIALRPDRTVDPERVRRMTDLIRHRGPDGSGLYALPGGRVALGHRRLSVIDLASGQQPMAEPQSGAVVVFNGEIYNYRELRASLVEDGEPFTTESDTEVLLRLYLRTGTAFLSRLRGMFAFALYDPRTGDLILARDRIGKKPLYHATVDGIFYFASTFAAVRAGAGLDHAIDPDAVYRYLNLGYVPAPFTIHPAIRKLEAGTFATIHDSEIRFRKYWDPSVSTARFSGRFEEAVDQLDELLITATRLRLRSDVPLGVFLSGGVDSSLVSAIAARHNSSRLRTFSIGFEESGFDESGFAAEIARRIGSEHREFRLRVDALQLVPELVHHFGEPFADSSAIPTWLLAEETRRHVTVALGGDGGDEAFAGYDWYRTALRLDRLAHFVPPALARFSSRVIGGSSPFGRRARASRAMSLFAKDEPARFAALRSFLDPVLSDAVCTDALKMARPGHGHDEGDVIAAAFCAAEGTPLRRMRVADIRTYLADCLMPKVDVASMAHALEVRAPLLDHEVVEFALSLPDEWVSDERTGKRILRAVLRRYLPGELFERPKQGFSVPLALWFVRELRPFVDALPSSERLLDTKFFSGDGIRGIIAEHSAGFRDHSQRLYSLVVLDEWLKRI